MLTTLKYSSYLNETNSFKETDGFSKYASDEFLLPRAVSLIDSEGYQKFAGYMCSKHFCYQSHEVHNFKTHIIRLSSDAVYDYEEMVRFALHNTEY